MEPGDLKRYLSSKGIRYKEVCSGTELQMDCVYPDCKKKNKLYMSLHPNPAKAKTARGISPGHHECKSCGEGGTIHRFKRVLGDLPNIWKAENKVKAFGGSQFLKGRSSLAYNETPKAMPDPGIDMEYHKALMQAPKGETEDENILAAWEFLTKERCLSEEQIVNFRIGYHELEFVDKRTRKNVKIPSICFPYYGVDEKCYLIKYRGIRPTKKGKKFMSRWKDCKSIPFGLDLLDESEDYVIITEGEFDAMSLYEYGLKNVISVPNGARSWDHAWTRYLIPFERVILACDQDTTGQEGARAIAEKVGKVRCLNLLLPLNDANKCLQAGVTAEEMQIAFDEAEAFPGCQIKEITDLRTLLFERLNGGEKTIGISTGYENLDLLLAGWREKEVTILTGDTGTGKAQPISSNVLTPNGWKSIGSLNVGDLVVTPDGRNVPILGVFPQGEKDVYRLTTKDGASTRCCKDHLWSTQTSKQRSTGNSKVRTLEEMIPLLRRGDGSLNLTIPHIGKIDVIGEDLPIDPYLMGVLLGDGSFRGSSVKVSTQNKEMQDKINELLPDGISLVRIKEGLCDFRISTGNPGVRNHVMMAIKDLGLHDLLSPQKFIPSIYFNTSHNKRLRLLQGLMDSDGTIDKRTGSVSFCTTSIALCEDVRRLVWSIGGTVGSVKSRYTRYRYNGKMMTGKESYRFSICLPNDVSPFKHNLDKLSKVKPKVKYFPRKFVKSIEPDGREECVCIAIDSDDQLYITDDYIVTHNTTYLLTLILRIARNGSGVLLGNFEQPAEHMAAKLVAMIAQKSFMDLTEDELSVAIDELESLPIYFLDAFGSVGLESLKETIEYCARYIGIGTFIFDPLQRAIDDDLQNSFDDRKIYNKAMILFKGAAMDYSVRVLLVVHPVKLPNDRKGRRVELNDLPASARVKQDVDNVLRVWVKQDKSGVLTPHVEVAALKVRSEIGRLGIAYYEFDPDTLVYREQDAPYKYREQDNSSSSQTDKKIKQLKKRKMSPREKKESEQGKLFNAKEY